MISKSYAKINLSLKVLGKREDGYHLLQMVNLPLTLHDIIIFEPLPKNVITHIVCDDPGLSSLKHNLCLKAFNLMQEKYGFDQHFLIKIHKEIPFAAGLGGGSSNAATVLLGLNKILKLGASVEELSELGLKIGADVPFFLRNKPMEVGGIGETMKEINVKKNWHIVLAKPQEGVSTSDVYSICDNFPKTNVDTSLVEEGLAEFDEDKIARGIGNDLMAPAESLLPGIGDVYSLLKKFGFPIVSMSGSGSCCFGLTKSESLAKDAFRKFDKMGYVVRCCKILL
jgi:4-diphosphocytidyl-2-C-methyl-D-erythritol kinase